MDDQLRDIQADIKHMLQNQARLEERISINAQDMHMLKEENKESFITLRAEVRLVTDDLREQIKPINNVYTGAKWLAGIAIFFASIGGAVSKLIGKL